MVLWVIVAPSSLTACDATDPDWWGHHALHISTHSSSYQNILIATVIQHCLWLCQKPRDFTAGRNLWDHLTQPPMSQIRVIRKVKWHTQQIGGRTRIFPRSPDLLISPVIYLYVHSFFKQIFVQALLHDGDSSSHWYEIKSKTDVIHALPGRCILVNSTQPTMLISPLNHNGNEEVHNEVDEVLGLLTAQERIYSQNCHLLLTHIGPTPWMLLPLMHNTSSLTPESNLDSNLPFSVVSDKHVKPVNVPWTLTSECECIKRRTT